MSEIELTLGDVKVALAELNQESLSLRIDKIALSRRVSELTFQLSEAEGSNVTELEQKEA